MKGYKKYDVVIIGAGPAGMAALSALQEPLNPFRAFFYLTFVLIGQPWIFFSSTWFSLTRRHPK